jgi:tetratricopeptide (TPR) repeat protein
MHSPAVSPSERLQRLQAYLRQDPCNGQLLGEVCDAALEAGAHAAAQACIASARELKLAPAPWDHRAAHLAIAQRQYPQALAVLQRLRATEGDSAALSHDVALVHLRAGDAQRSRSELAPWLDSAPSDNPATQAAVQVLWLRATQRCGLVAEASAWAAAQADAGTLSPAAAGVASLSAVDGGDFALARRLADQALRAGAASQEALVARGSVALAERAPVVARGLLQQALAFNPEDGRTLSALGMAHLQAGEFAPARTQFTQAVAKLPRHIGSWHGLGWACLLQGDQAAAGGAFGQALALDRNFAESHGAVGLVSLLAGRHDEAQHHLDVADRLDRNNVTARYARALQSGQLRDAEGLRVLAARLLDRPGLFGGRLGDALRGGME